MIHAQSIMQRMGQAVTKVNPRAVTSTGQQAAAGAGRGASGAAQAITRFQHGVFEETSYHHQNSTGAKSKGPKDGQTALDHSVQITKNKRIGVSEGEYVILRWTRLDAKTGKDLYHGHVEASSWKDLSKEMKKLFEKHGFSKF